MTERELDQLISCFPTLYHMAERGSWASIKENGLMSTSALLDYYHITGHQREVIEQQHRPDGKYISAQGSLPVWIRDQHAMSDDGLRRALPENMKPSDWYKILNSKVFFWLTEERLHRMTNAGPYRERAHDVLEVDTKFLIENYRARIWFCPINSGNTKRRPSKRDETTFSRIETFPYKRDRSKSDRVAELAVDYAIPDIVRYIRRVVVKQGEAILSVVYG